MHFVYFHEILMFSILFLSIEVYINDVVYKLNYNNLS